MWVLITALCKPSLGAPGYVAKILQAKSGQKVDDFEAMDTGISRQLPVPILMKNGL